MSEGKRTNRTLTETSEEVTKHGGKLTARKIVKL